MPLVPAIMITATHDGIVFTVLGQLKSITIERQNQNQPVEKGGQQQPQQQPKPGQQQGQQQQQQQDQQQGQKREQEQPVAAQTGGQQKNIAPVDQATDRE